jgi:hypothetical protein
MDTSKDMPHDDDTRADAPHSRLRYEIALASLLLALGLFVLPALIYWVGSTMLGPYGETDGAHLGRFYGDFFGDLASGSVRTWCLAFGPLFVVEMVRLLFLRRPDPAVAEDAPRPTPSPKPQSDRRVEPRVSLD